RSLDPQAASSSAAVSSAVVLHPATLDTMSVNGMTPVDASSLGTPVAGSSWDNAFLYDPSGSSWMLPAGAGLAGDSSGATDGNPDAMQIVFFDGPSVVDLDWTLASGPERPAAG